jgi:hypothetical protein
MLTFEYISPNRITAIRELLKSLSAWAKRYRLPVYVAVFRYEMTIAHPVFAKYGRILPGAL